MVVSNRNILFLGSIFRGCVSFREGRGGHFLNPWWEKTTSRQALGAPDTSKTSIWAPYMEPPVPSMLADSIMISAWLVNQKFQVPEIPRDPGSPKLRMVSWNLNTMRFGDDRTPLHHYLTIWRLMPIGNVYWNLIAGYFGVGFFFPVSISRTSIQLRFSDEPSILGGGGNCCQNGGLPKGLVARMSCIT